MRARLTYHLPKAPPPPNPPPPPLKPLADIPLSARWISWSIGLYLLAGACWLPVVWLQIKMQRLAAEACDSNSELPASYWRYFRLWVALGIPAFFALVIVFYLMVAKPV